MLANSVNHEMAYSLYNITNMLDTIIIIEMANNIRNIIIDNVNNVMANDIANILADKKILTI